MSARSPDTHLSGCVIESQEVLLAPYGDADCKGRSGGGERSSQLSRLGAVSFPPPGPSSPNPAGGTRARLRGCHPFSPVPGSPGSGLRPGCDVAPQLPNLFSQVP